MRAPPLGKTAPPHGGRLFTGKATLFHNGKKTTRHRQSDAPAPFSSDGLVNNPRLRKRKHGHCLSDRRIAVPSPYRRGTLSMGAALGDRRVEVPSLDRLCLLRITADQIAGFLRRPASESVASGHAPIRCNRSARLKVTRSISRTRGRAILFRLNPCRCLYRWDAARRRGIGLTSALSR